MSKSYGNTINMFAPKNVLKKQVMSIVTDSANLKLQKILTTISLNFINFLFLKKNIKMRAKFMAGGYG